MPDKILPKEEIKLPKPEVELPKPETDLPLPEKDLPKPTKSSKAEAESSELMPMSTTSYKPSYMWLKILALILVLILIFASAFALLQNNSTKTLPPSPTPTKTVDETANWKTFASQKYNFSFKYPLSLTSTETISPFYFVDLKMNNAQAGEKALYTIQATKDTFTAKDPASYNFLSADVFNALSLLTSGQTKQYATVVFTKQQDTTIAGQKAISVNVKSTADMVTNQKRLFVKYSGNIYMIIYDLSTNQTELDQILSTFKFTDSTSQKPTDETANWKTYNGKGFTFKYPNEWIENGAKINLPPDPSCPQCAPGPGNIYIKIYDNPNSLSLSEYLKTNSNSFGGDYYIKDFGSYSVPGIKEAMLNPKSLGAYDVQKEAIISSGKNIISISCTGGACTNAYANAKGFEVILSTFKFTQ